MALIQRFRKANLFTTVRIPAVHVQICGVANMTRPSPSKQDQVSQEVSASSTGRKRLVILGTGWGSYAVLRDVNRKLYDVQVVSPRNHFLFTPLLASTTVGTLEFRSIIEPVRNVGFRNEDHFHLSHAVDLDPSRGVVTCQSVLKDSLRYELPYDRLVIGVGALTNTFGVPGVNEHACFLKEVWDARRIRSKILDNFELALQPGVSEEDRTRLLHIVIVGGGPTGVEFGAELYDFVQQDVARLYRSKQKKVQVTIVESHRLLGAFDDRLRNYAEKKINARDKFQLIQSAVTEVCADHVKLADGREIPCGLVVWSTGLAPRVFTLGLKLQKNRAGQIVTDKHLQVLDTPTGSVFSLGDCADIKDYPLPCTAAVAERQGRYLAKLLTGLESNPEPSAHKEYSFTSPGMLTYLGDYQALSQLPKDIRLQGVPSWFLWRSAYLTRLGSWRLRMQVPIDWTKTLLFGRDISRIE